MRVEDLMVDDWVDVYHELPDESGFYKPLQITGTHHKEGVCFGDNIIESPWIDPEEFGEAIKPIPLTPEILEKNGFIRCGEDSLYPQYNDCTYRFSDNRGHVVLLEYIGWSRGYYNVHDITTIHGVHELQHIFKIKKIKKEIVL